MVSINLNTKIEGPILKGESGRIVSDFMSDLLHDLGELGADKLQDETSVFKNPTGFFESQIRSVDLVDTTLIEVQDVVYDTWLEAGRAGTAFSGYGLFAKATGQIEAKLDGELRQAANELVRKLDG